MHRDEVWACLLLVASKNIVGTTNINILVHPSIFAEETMGDPTGLVTTPFVPSCSLLLFLFLPFLLFLLFFFFFLLFLRLFLYWLPHSLFCQPLHTIFQLSGNRRSRTFICNQLFPKGFFGLSCYNRFRIAPSFRLTRFRRRLCLLSRSRTVLLRCSI